MKKALSLFLVICLSVIMSTSVFASESERNDLDEGEGSSRAILHVTVRKMMPSNYVEAEVSFSYHDYYGTIAGISSCRVASFYSSYVAQPTVTARAVNGNKAVLVTATYYHLKSSQWMSETLTIYP